MSTAKKAFKYVFSTVSEDHKVSKVLSGRKPTDKVLLADPSTFGAQA